MIMKPTIESFLQRGYFPKELPPPFNTFSFGTKYSEIKAEWQKVLDNPTKRLTQDATESADDFIVRKKEFKDNFKKYYSSSICLRYSISKGRLSRRYIGIPNPLQYMYLSEKITEAWDDIINIINQSQYSQSKPVYQDEFSRRTLTTSSSGVAEFIRQMLDASFNKKVELRLDLSKFYPTIYTHSIPWAILGKNEAKEIYSKGKEEIKRLSQGGDLKALLYNKADAIDTATRNCQGQQTIGIPIGPDISYTIAELINSRIDVCLNDFNSKLTGCRYYDDYYLYVNTIEEAEEIFKFLQAKLYEFGLEINESKVSIKKFPFEFVEKFSADLSQFSFSKRFEQSIKLYFNIIWKFAEKTPEKISHIFRYALKIFEPSVIDRISIQPHNWKIFENLLLKTILLDPTILDVACRILESYKTIVSKDKLQELVNLIFKEHIPINQHLEVSWAFWICKKFDLIIETEVCIKALRMRDTVSCLILLDIINNLPHLITSTPELTTEISNLEQSFNEESLRSEDWLLLYESTKKGWVSRIGLIDNNLFFSILKDKNIEFYDLDPDVNFTSDEYVFSRSELVITEKMKNQAEKDAKKIFNEVLERKANEIKEEQDDSIDTFFGIENLLTIEEIKENIKEDLEDIKAYKEIYNSILSDLIRTNPINQEQMIINYLSKLHYYSMYCE